MRDQESLKAQVGALRQQLDLANARAKAPDPSADKVALLTQQCEKLGFENNQLAASLEEARRAGEEGGEAHQRALQKMRTDKARLKREAGAAQAETKEVREENEQSRGVHRAPRQVQAGLGARASTGADSGSGEAQAEIAQRKEEEEQQAKRTWRRSKVQRKMQRRRRQRTRCRLSLLPSQRKMQTGKPAWPPQRPRRTRSE